MFEQCQRGCFYVFMGRLAQRFFTTLRSAGWDMVSTKIHVFCLPIARLL